MGFVCKDFFLFLRFIPFSYENGLAPPLSPPLSESKPFAISLDCAGLPEL